MKNELNHHGILGQRWGVRRFQKRDGTLTKEGKRHIEQLKKESPEEYKREKEKAVRSGNAKLVKQWAPNLTAKELDEAVLRADRNKRLSEIVSQTSKIEKGFKYVDRIANYANTVANVTSKTYGTYDKIQQARLKQLK